MSKKITEALIQAGASIVAQTIQSTVRVPSVSPAAAQIEAQRAVAQAVQTPIVQNAIAAVVPTPIKWWHSPTLWGAVVAALPNLLVVGGQVIGVSIAEGDAAQLVQAGSAFVGAFMVAWGRTGKVSPIEGTKAAEAARKAAQ